MTERIQEFLRNRRSEGLDIEPCLVVDLEVVRDNYQTFAKALPDSRVFYAVKANPAPEVLSLLASLGSCFDTATVAEIEMALAAGATPDRISYGNTIKKERDIARAFALGIRLFAVDCAAEVEKSSTVFRDCAERGINLSMVNMGGGFPTRYLKDVPPVVQYGRSIFRALRKHFGNQIPETIIEPGRGMVGNAGVIKAEVVLVSKKSDNDNHRWVFLDIGKFGGLAETMDEAIRYPIRTARDEDQMEPCVLAGPTCDSADVMYEKNMYPLPISLTIGDEVLIEGTGAYTTTYSAVAFNGFEPLKAYVI